MRAQSNCAPHRDGREASHLNQPSSAPARGRERYAALRRENAVALNTGFRMLALSCLSCALGGCVGVGLVYEHSREMQHANNNLAMGKARGMIFEGDIFATTMRKEDVLKRWGPPDKNRTDGKFEVLVYRRELAFSGAIVYLLIPIPLLAPVGYRHTHLYFTEGALSKAIEESGDGPQLMCGLRFNRMGGANGICGVLDGLPMNQ